MAYFDYNTVPIEGQQPMDIGQFFASAGSPASNITSMPMTPPNMSTGGAVQPNLPIAPGTPGAPGSPQPGMMSKIGDTVYDLLKSGVIAQMFADNTTLGGRMAGVAGKAMQAQAMNENYKRMLTSMLGGQPTAPGAPGTTPGFQSSPSAGGPISSTAAMGLSPELVKEFYSTALTQLEKEREFPLKQRKVEAEAGQSEAAAGKAVQEAIEIGTRTGYVPMDKLMEVLKGRAMIKEAGARTELAGAQAVEAGATTKLKGEQARAATPEGQAITAGLETKKGEAVARAGGEKPFEMIVGDQTGVYDPRTRRFQPLGKAPVKPGAGDKDLISPAQFNQAKYLTSTEFMPIYEQQLVKKFGAGATQVKDKMSALRYQLESAKDVDGVAAALGSVRGYLDAPTRVAFDASLQRYVNALKTNGDIAQATMDIQKALSGPTAGAPAAGSTQDRISKLDTATKSALQNRIILEMKQRPEYSRMSASDQEKARDERVGYYLAMDDASLKKVLRLGTTTSTPRPGRPGAPPTSTEPPGMPGSRRSELEEFKPFGPRGGR